jgi:hypothetical protein
VGRIATDSKALLTGEGKGFRRPMTEDEAEVNGFQTLFKPGEIWCLTVCLQLIGLRRDVEAVYDPGVILLELKEAHPGLVGFQRMRFFLGLVVD